MSDDTDLGFVYGVTDGTINAAEWFGVRGSRTCGNCLGGERSISRRQFWDSLNRLGNVGHSILRQWNCQNGENQQVRTRGLREGVVRQST